MKHTIRFAALLFAALTFLGACSADNGENELMSAVRHTPGDSGYIPMYSEVTSSQTDGEKTDDPVATETGIPFTSDEPSSAVTAIETIPGTQTAVFPTTETPTAEIPTKPVYPAPSFKCSRCFVFDVQNDCFLYLSGADKVVYPASTTKLLTILYARTLLSPDLVVAAGDELEMVREHSSLAYIRQEDKHALTVEQLIEAMLLPSGNDAAHVLAAAGGRALDPSVENGKKAVERFMEGMNRYAIQLGLVGSVFLTPDGYDVEGHFTTLEDMAIVAREAYKDKLIRKYAATVYDHVTYASGHVIDWYNTNACINPDSPYYVPEVNGLKTGTKDSNYYCLISSAEIKGRSFIFGFFGETASADRFEDTRTAVNWIKAYVL